jgi:hypothetical protein
MWRASMPQLSVRATTEKVEFTAEAPALQTGHTLLGCRFFG